MSSRRATDLAELMDRELGILAAEVAAYPSEESLWRTGGEIANSAGTLVLHLVGNLEHFVGAVLGGSPYRRDREAEFGRRDVERSELLRMIAEARGTVASVLDALEETDLDRRFPGAPPDLGDPTVGKMLVHLHGHLGYHLGQVNYHRRLVAAAGS